MTTLLAWTGDMVRRAVPFRRLGRSYDGVDCWGLVYLAYRDVYGIQLPSYDNLYEPGDVHRSGVVEGLVRAHMDVWKGIPPGGEVEGDGIFFCSEESWPHVALVTVPGKMVHVEQDVGVSHVSYRDPLWSHRLEQFRRHAAG